MTTLNDLINDYTLEVIDLTLETKIADEAYKENLKIAQENLIEDIKSLILKLID